MLDEGLGEILLFVRKGLCPIYALSPCKVLDCYPLVAPLSGIPFFLLLFIFGSLLVERVAPPVEESRSDFKKIYISVNLGKSSFCLPACNLVF